jgi:ribosomal protein L7Ae-like RNA K-turn-binding protein
VTSSLPSGVPFSQRVTHHQKATTAHSLSNHLKHLHRREEVVEEVEVELDPLSALRTCLRNSLYHEGLARGLHETVKALDRKEAHLCVLSNSCNEPGYTTLIAALCAEHSIPLIKVEDSKTVG